MKEPLKIMQNGISRECLVVQHDMIYAHLLQVAADLSLCKHTPKYPPHSHPHKQPRSQAFSLLPTKVISVTSEPCIMVRRVWVRDTCCLLTTAHGSKVTLVIMLVQERVYGKEAEGVGSRLLTASSTLVS